MTDNEGRLRQAEIDIAYLMNLWKKFGRGIRVAPGKITMYWDVEILGEMEIGEVYFINWTEDQGATNIHIGNIPTLSSNTTVLGSMLVSLAALVDPDGDQHIMWDDSEGEFVFTDLSALYQPLNSMLTSLATLTDPDADQFIMWDDDANEGAGGFVFVDDVVTGPASATDNAIARFDGETGKLIQDSGIEITDDDIISIDGGTHLQKISADHEGSLSFGSYFDGTNWIATDIRSTILYAGYHSLGFYNATGLTPGNSFTPTLQLWMGQDGTFDFTQFPTTPEEAPDADYEVANKKYVDDNAGGSGTVLEWLNIDDYYTDDYADALQAAIDALPSTGGVVYIPPGTYEIDTMITIGAGDGALGTAQDGIQIIGAGMGNAAHFNREYYSSDVTGGTILKWTGSSGGTMFKYDGPTGGCRLANMTLDGNQTLGTFLDVQWAHMLNVENILGVDWQGDYAVAIQNPSVGTISSGSWSGFSKAAGHEPQTWKNVHFMCPYGTAAKGLDLAPSGSLSLHALLFEGCTFQFSNTSSGIGLRLGNVDHSVFTRTFFQPYRVPYNATLVGVKDIVIKPISSTYNQFPNNIYFFGSPIYSGIYYDNTVAWVRPDTPAIIFYPYFTADDQTIPPNVVSGSAALPDFMVGGFTDMGNHLMDQVGDTLPTYHRRDHDRFFETDQEKDLFYDSGNNQWLTVSEYSISNGENTVGDNGYVIRVAMPSDWYATYCEIRAYVLTTNDASNYWTVTVRGTNLAGSSTTTLYTFNTASNSADTWYDKKGITTHDPGSNTSRLEVYCAKTGSPGVLVLPSQIFYRQVVT